MFLDGLSNDAQNMQKEMLFTDPRWQCLIDMVWFYRVVRGGRVGDDREAIGFIFVETVERETK